MRETAAVKLAAQFLVDPLEEVEIEQPVRAAASLYARGLNPKDFLYAGALAVVGLVVPLIMVPSVTGTVSSRL